MNAAWYGWYGNMQTSQAKQLKTLVIGDLLMDNARHTVTRADKSLNLTKREYNLLEYLLINQNIVSSREQILENVWGYDFIGDTNIVDVYVRYLRSKMDEPFPKKLLHTIRGVGYTIKAVSYTHLTLPTNREV